MPKSERFFGEGKNFFLHSISFPSSAAVNARQRFPLRKEKRLENFLPIFLPPGIKSEKKGEKRRRRGSRYSAEEGEGICKKYSPSRKREEEGRGPWLYRGVGVGWWPKSQCSFSAILCPSSSSSRFGHKNRMGQEKSVEWKKGGKVVAVWCRMAQGRKKERVPGVLEKILLLSWQDGFRVLGAKFRKFGTEFLEVWAVQLCCSRSFQRKRNW